MISEIKAIKIEDKVESLKRIGDTFEYDNLAIKYVPDKILFIFTRLDGSKVVAQEGDYIMSNTCGNSSDFYMLDGKSYNMLYKKQPKIKTA